jgi:1-deoxy-D-xylulose-5-phosphate reductoisomerase
MKQMKRIVILGSTGSIGTQTLDIVDKNEDIQVMGLSVYSNINLLERQIEQYKPKKVCVMDSDKALELKKKVSKTSVEVLAGIEGLIELVQMEEVTMVVTALVGMIGIQPTIEAIKAGKHIALANKETLVTAGNIIMPLAKKKGVSILPVDSEHSAIFQCLNGENNHEVEKIILTASGGPFRGKTLEELKEVNLEDALRHPNWSMGSKITIDSATLMNKGLEVIEAKWLFNLPLDKIQVVVHPQSIIHSMVEFMDGSIIAQMGQPDMRLPIQYALYYPKRMKRLENKTIFNELEPLTFEKPDLETFKALLLAFKALEIGGSMPTVLNAANEYAVSKFLNKKIKFLDIPKIVEYAMEQHDVLLDPSLNDILETENWTYEILESRWSLG